MSGHATLRDLHVAAFDTVDPGNGGVLFVDRWGEVFPLRSGASDETRTLVQPDNIGQVATVKLLEHGGGDVVLTVTGGYNQAGSTTITFDAAGDWVIFYSIETSSGFYWRIMGQEGTDVLQTNMTLGTVTAGRVNGEYVVDGYTYAATRAGIQAAIDAAIAAGGGRVRIPVGEYTIDSPLLIDAASNINLVGDGWGTVLKLADNLTALSPGDIPNVLEITNSSGVRVGNLCVDGNYAGQAGMPHLTMRFAAVAEGTGGMTIQYTGAGSAATLTISSATLTTSCTGAAVDDLNLDLTAAGYDTLAELVAYINGLANYTCTKTATYAANSYTPGMTEGTVADIKSAPVAVPWNSSGDPTEIEIYGNCLFVQDSDHVTIDTCELKNAAHIGVLFYSGCTNFQVVHCSAHHCNWRPIEVWPDDEVGLDDTSQGLIGFNDVGESYNTPIAIEYVNDTACLVIGNKVRITDSTFSAGTDCLKGGIHFYKGGGHVAIGNSLWGCGIWVSSDTGSLKHHSIIGNRIDGRYVADGYESYGININGDYCVVQGNTVNDTYYAGFTILGGEYCVVSGNVFSNMANAIIAYLTADNNTFVDNQFDTISGDVITDAGTNNTWIRHANGRVEYGVPNGSNVVEWFSEPLMVERSANPPAPAEGTAIIWMSDGTGAMLGDDGDVLIASTAGGVTKYAVLFDHSAGTAWPA